MMFIFPMALADVWTDAAPFSFRHSVVIFSVMLLLFVRD